MIVPSLESGDAVEPLYLVHRSLGVFVTGRGPLRDHEMLTIRGRAAVVDVAPTKAPIWEFTEPLRQATRYNGKADIPIDDPDRRVVTLGNLRSDIVGRDFWGLRQAGRRLVPTFYRHPAGSS